MDLTLEKFVDGAWRQAARLTIEEPSLGIASSCLVEYLPDYALAYMGAIGEPALSVRLPVTFNHTRFERWAPFLLDMLPSGFGRDLLVVHAQLAQPDGPLNDAAVLARGASNPAGNVRVAEAYTWLQSQLPISRSGWSLPDMQRHDIDFIEYARVHGTLVAGTSTQGQAAKLWLTEHADGLFYADILVPDMDARAHYLVKMPRNDKDAILLRHEFYWLQLAKGAGLNVCGEPFMSGELLFIPRFDRIPVAGSVHRRALESAYSLLGVAAHAQPLRHEDILEAWVAQADTAVLGIDLLEYLKRDILGYCLRVEDNHGRNTGFFLTEAGLTLSPLFDFSPMFLADDPPARSTLWRQFTPGSHTEWARLFADWLPSLLGAANSEGLRRALVEWQPQLAATYQQFLSLDRDPRTRICEHRFEAALEVLDALR
ncbi:MAG: HipA domain-containing protein [Formivibrio sp.]|nr:HipA domain-containing protein [Formivibrio sp.]